MKLALLLACLLATAAYAHHGAAEYHVDRETVVSGVIKEWRWTNPHTWIHVTVSRPDGSVEEWTGEGPPRTWAAQRGWSNTTLRSGESVSLVMYPSRRDERAGLVKRIERKTGGTLVVSRPWLDR